MGRRLVAPLCVAGLVVVAVLVQSGVTRPLDRYTLDHLQPLSSGSWSDLAVPADPFVAALLVALGTSLVWRRRGWAAAWPWPVALAASLVIEAAGKAWVAQIHFADPERVLDLVSLPGSFPSGHVTRAVILAGLAGALWPRLRLWPAVFVAFMAVWVVVSGMHVITDVAGGLLLGGALVGAAGRRPGGQGG